MKMKRVTSLIMITILLVVSLVGCKSNTDAVTDVAEQTDYNGLITAEQNYFNMSNKELETVIKAIADYEVCRKVQMKLLNNENLFSKSIVDELYSGKEIQGTVADCDCDNTVTKCEHQIEAEEFNKSIPKVRDFDQTQMETWYGGPVALSEMTLNIVTYNVFPVSETELLISVKFYDTDKQMKNIMGKYDNEKRIITEVK